MRTTREGTFTLIDGIGLTHRGTLMGTEHSGRERAHGRPSTGHSCFSTAQKDVWLNIGLNWACMCHVCFVVIQFL